MKKKKLKNTHCGHLVLQNIKRKDIQYTLRVKFLCKFNSSRYDIITIIGVIDIHTVVAV